MSSVLPLISGRARPFTLVTLALTVGALNARPAEAQQALLGPGAGYIAMGVSRIATGELDARLASRGDPTFGRRATAIGIGAYRTLTSGLMLGGEFNGLIIGEHTRGGRETGLGGGYATLGAGYMKAISPRTRVYPRLGLGVGGLGLWMQSAPDTVDFDDVLTDPRPVPERDPVLSRDGMVMDFGIGAELLPSGKGNGVMVGLRAGYLAAFFGSGSNWSFYQNTVTRGPSASIAGLYLRVMVGGAWSR